MYNTYVIIFGLVSELVLHRIHKGEDEINGNKLLEKSFLLVSFGLTAVDPNIVGDMASIEDHLSPEFTAFGVTLIGGGRAEREPQTDHETQYRKQD